MTLKDKIRIGLHNCYLAGQDNFSHWTDEQVIDIELEEIISWFFKPKYFNPQLFDRAPDVQPIVDVDQEEIEKCEETTKDKQYFVQTENMKHFINACQHLFNENKNQNI